jgi:heterotetrameric sarcosine oxidase gamma subunit
MSNSITATEVVGFKLLHVATRGDVRAAATELATALDIPVSDLPGAVAAKDDGRRVLWFGPGRWLVQGQSTHFSLGELPGSVVTDLSDSRRIFSLRGAGVANYLSRHCPLDLDVEVMRPGTCALTQFDRFGVLLYRDAEHAFDLYVETSYAAALPDEIIFDGSSPRLTDTKPADT